MGNLTETPPIDLSKRDGIVTPEGILLRPIENGLHITVLDGAWRTFDLARWPAAEALDLTGTADLELNVKNLEAEPVTFTLLFESIPDSAGKSEQAAYMLKCLPGENRALRLPFFHLPYSYSGWNWPNPWCQYLVCSWGTLDISKIGGLKIRIKGKGDFEFTGLRRYNPAPVDKWIDAYGQRTDKEWEGKIASDEDLKKAERAEREASAPKRPELDEFQAWKSGPQLKATGFFRTEKVNGKWWLVAPNGHVFFSAGLNCIVPGVETSLRSNLVKDSFTWMPPKEGDYASAWGARDGHPTVSYHRTNMIRKWGKDKWEGRAEDRAFDRMQRWGFNTIGNWSNPKLVERRKYPWVNVGPNTYAPETAPMQVPYVGHKIHDPFHSAFYTEAVRIAWNGIGRFRDDPMLIGNFINNEVGWDHFFYNLLLAPDDQPAKAELIKDLVAKYGTIEALNAAWGSAAKSFAELRWPGEFDPQFTPQANSDLSEFRGKFADLWYNLWAKAMREVDPNHLVLGSRLHGAERFEEVLIAAGKYCDVVSFNEYETAPDPERFAIYYKLINKPFIVGEFGHNSLDTGNLTCAVPVQTQKDRAIGYRLYMETLAAQPWFVGAHYFQYYDEPILGRFDTETAYNGFIAVTDIPWEPLAAAAAETNPRLYTIHEGTLEPVTERPQR